MPSSSTVAILAAQGSLLAVEKPLIILTWVTFLLMAGVLYAVAWKPIMQALDKREADIQQSLDDAARAREELAKIEETQRRKVAEADQQAKGILDGARSGADELRRLKEREGQREAQILVENATREIRSMSDQAQAQLRQESAELAVSLAAKIIGENLDEVRSRALVDKLIQEI